MLGIIKPIRDMVYGIWQMVYGIWDIRSVDGLVSAINKLASNQNHRAISPSMQK